MWWWLIGLVLVACAGAGIFFAARSPTFVSGLTSLAIGAAWNALAPRILKRKSPELEAMDRQAVREGRERDTNMHGPKPANRKPTGKITVKINK